MGRPKKDLVCRKCGSTFASRQSLYLHEKKKVCETTRPKGKRAGQRPAAKPKYACGQCDQKFTRQDNLKQHERRVHSGVQGFVHLCGLCPQFFRNLGAVKLHRQLNHPYDTTGGRDGFKRVRMAHRKACEFYRLEVPPHINQIDRAIQDMLPALKRLLRHQLVDKRNMKASLTMNLRMIKASADEVEAAGPVHGVEGVDVLTMPMVSPFKQLRYLEDNEEESIASMLDHIQNTVDVFTHNGSGWVVGDVLTFDVQINQCQALAGSCTSHYYVFRGKQHPRIIHEEEQQVADRMNGNRCFFRAVARCLMEGQTTGLVTETLVEEFIHANICENVETPVRVKDIARFEEANEHLDLAINVLFKDDFTDDIYPCRASPNIRATNQVNLMLFHTAPPPKRQKGLKEEEEEEGGGEGGMILHYAWIKDLSSVMGSKRRSKAGNSYKHKTHLCHNCMLQFHSIDALVNHASWCHTEKGQRKVLPEEGDCVKYDGIEREIKIPHCFVFDFETMQQKPDQACACKPEMLHKCTHKTKVVANQEPFAYALVMVDYEGKVCEHIRYLGENAAEHFVETLVDLETKYRQIDADNYKQLVVTPDIKARHDSTTNCYLCGKKMGYDKCMDHDHQTGEYLGAAHTRCNFLRAENRGQIVGFAHNFSGEICFLFFT